MACWLGIGEGLGRHVRVANHVVMLAEQLLLVETADPDEVRVHIGDVAVEVGGGEDVGAIAVTDLAASDGQVHTHDGFSRASRSCCSVQLRTSGCDALWRVALAAINSSENPCLGRSCRPEAHRHGKATYTS